MKSITTWAARAAIAGLVVTGLIGAMHLPFAAPLARHIMPASFCPATKGSPAQIDRGHELAVRSLHADGPSTAAPARPALGFTLDVSRRDDLEAWAKKSKVACSAIRGNDNLQKCAHVPAAAVGQDASLPELEEVTFELNSRGVIVNVQTMRRGLSAETAASTASLLERRTAEAVGDPTTTAGAPTAQHLSHGYLTSYVAEHRFRDYRATITATNMAHTGMMVREEYLSAL